MTTIGYTAGVFDMFHIGHLNLLEKARRHCDVLIVGLTTDELCQNYKHKNPVIPYFERAAIVRSLRLVDDVIPQHFMDRYSMWKERRFDVTFVGDDWRGSDLWIDYEEKFANVGVRVVYLPYTSHISSTLLRKRSKPSDHRQAQIVLDSNDVTGNLFLAR
ncbi:MAG TPA: adenylyltransferase/cytidyltransferase family protein [Acidimicrobiales bacterium]